MHIKLITYRYLFLLRDLASTYKKYVQVETR